MELEVAFELMGEKLKGNGKNKNGKCPLAQWTHGGGKDRSPSLTATDGTPALFRCWACNNQGSVKKLTKIFGEYSGDFRAYQFVCDTEGEKSNYWNTLAVRKPSYSNYGFQKKIGKKIDDSNKTITEEMVLEWKKTIPKYAVERGMTIKEIDQWEIGYDKKEKRMIFPIRDISKKLVGVSGRALVQGQLPKYKHYYGLRKEKVLYGENYTDPNSSRAYIVEGFFDVIGLTAKGVKNVFATMGTSLSDYNIERIIKRFDELIFLPDMDDPGLIFAAEQARKVFLLNKIRVGIAGGDVSSYDDNSFRYSITPFSGLEGKDPGDWDMDSLNIILSKIFWLK